MVTLRVRVASPAPRADAIRWLFGGPGGAAHFVRIRARGSRPQGLGRDWRKNVAHACKNRLGASSARRATVLLHYDDESSTPILTVGAAADHRADTFAAVDACIEALRDTGWIDTAALKTGRTRRSRVEEV